MANRLDYYFKQRVTEAELDLGFSYLEQADRYILADLGILGIVKNMAVVQHSPTPDLTVDVGDGSGESVAIDAYGQRVAFGAVAQNVDLSVDENSVSTAVASPGNSKIISLFVQFDRVLTDPRVDGNSLTVYFDRAESFKFVVVQGAEAVSPTPPALITGSILIADVTRIFGQTSFVTGDIDTSSRVQLPFKTNTMVAAKSLAEAFQQLEDAINAVSGGSFNASAINYGGGSSWNDGDTNGAATVEATLDNIFSDLSSTAGSDKIGAAAYTPTPTSFVDLDAGSIQDQLRTLADGLSGSVQAANITYAGNTGGWAAGGSIASGSVEATLDGIFEAMADTARGAAYIAMAEDASGATGGPYWADGDVASSLESLVKNIVDGTGGASGMAKYMLQSQSVTKFIRGNWQQALEGDYWRRSSSGGALQHIATGASTLIAYAVGEEIPDGATITRIKAKLRALGTYGGGLPGTLPRWSLLATDKSTGSFAGATSLAGPAVDASANTTAYKTYHDIDSGAISVVVDRAGKDYYVELTGESGANSEDDSLSVAGIEVTFTTTQVYAGAA